MARSISDADLHATFRRFMGILLKLALAVSDAGVRLRIGGGRPVEEHQHHRNGARSRQRGLPRWPAAIALLAVGALYGVLSDGLTLIPRAFLLGFVAVLLVPLLTAHLRGSYRLARGFGFGVIGLVTVALVVSVFLLVSSSLRGGTGTSAPALLQDAALLWVINVVTFAVWYWEIDGGGRRKLQAAPTTALSGRAADVACDAHHFDLSRRVPVQDLANRVSVGP